MDIETAKAGWDAGRDIVLFGIIAFLIFGYFRLDQVYTARRKQPRQAPATTPGDKRHEKSMRSDPDGQPWDGD